MKKLSFYIAGLLAIAALVIAGCAAPVHVEKDPQTDFSKYKTYAWIDENNGKKGKANDLEEKNVHEAVSKELQNSRWKEVTSNPDVLISYDVLIERSVRRETNPVYTQSASRLYFNPYTRRVWYYLLSFKVFGIRRLQHTYTGRYAYHYCNRCKYR